MFYFFKKILNGAIHAPPSKSWKYVVAFALFHFFSTWGLLYLFEPKAEYIRPEVFYYFYAVSASTIGYGDYSPTTTGARIVTIVYMFPFALIIAGYIIGIIATLFTNINTNRRNGMSQLKLRNHIIVFGENDGNSPSMITNILADGDKDTSVCLVSEHIENPLLGVLDNFVSGNILSPLVRKKCCLSDASTVIIYGQNDNQTIGEALTALEETNDNCRIILYFKQAASAKRFNSHSHDRIVCVSSVDMSVLVQEALDEGASDYITKLTDNEIEGSYMRYEIPFGNELAYHEVAMTLIKNGITPLGLYDGKEVNILTHADTVIRAGDFVAVAAPSRELLDKVNWN